MPSPRTTLTVPTALMRTGNFTELLTAGNSGGNGYQTQYPRCYPGGLASSTSPGLIFDPTTCDPAGVIRRTQFAYNGHAERDSDRPSESGRGRTISMRFPTPTRTDRYLNNYLDKQSEANKYNTFDGRIDWIASPNDMAFFRFSYDNSVNTKTSEFANLPAGGGTGINPTHARGYDLGYTHIFSPSHRE